MASASSAVRFSEEPDLDDGASVEDVVEDLHADEEAVRASLPISSPTPARDASAVRSLRAPFPSPAPPADD